MNLSEPLFLTVVQREREIKVDFSQQYRRGNSGLEREPFRWHLNGSNWDETGVTNGTFGDTAIFLPFMEKPLGIKIVREKYPGYLEKILENITYISSIKSDIFPEIFEFHKTTVNGSPCVVILMEKVEDKQQPVLDGTETWLPTADKIFVQNELSTPLKVLEHCIEEFAKHQLCPDLSWYKAVNLISGKIVDCQDFEYKPERYVLPNNNGWSRDRIAGMFQNALERYRKWINLPDSGNLPKWKGKSYQPVLFDEVGVPGYTSNNRIYDTWLKMALIPFGAPIIQKSEVLELGSCQGLFILQSAIHGCKHATGVEITEEDYQFAKEINEVVGLPNVTFINQDAVEFVKNDTKEYGLVIISSVLHQLFKNMVGCEEFMKSLISRSSYIFLEIPANHSKMSLDLETIQERLVSLVGGDENRVRFLYCHDAYSEGFRAQFLVYGHKQSI